MRSLIFGLCIAACFFPAGCTENDLAEHEQRQRGSALFRQAINAEESGNIDGAIELYKQIMIDEPKAYSAHFMLATLLHDHAEDYIGAIYHYRRYLELEPESEKKKLAQERINIAQHLLAPKLVRMVEDTSPSLQQAHLLKEAARLNGIITRLEGQKADLTEQVNEHQALLRRLAAENTQLRKIVGKMRSSEVLEGDGTRVTAEIGAMERPQSAESEGLSRVEIEALRREAAASTVKSEPERVEREVVNVPSVKSVLEKVQNRLTGEKQEQRGEDKKKEAALDRETRSVAKEGDLSDFSLFKLPGKEKPERAKREKQIYVVQPGDTLMRIAARFYGDNTKWKKIREANRGQIGPDGRIRAGQNIVIP
jgi:nucleoid-associated protein YgaU